MIEVLFEYITFNKRLYFKCDGVLYFAYKVPSQKLEYFVNVENGIVVYTIKDQHVIRSDKAFDNIDPEICYNNMLPKATFKIYSIDIPIENLTVDTIEGIYHRHINLEIILDDNI